MTHNHPISPMRHMARPRASRSMGAMGKMCPRHTTAALDAESAEVLENIKALLK